MSSTKLDVALHVSDHSETHEHVQAEPVGRVDGGCIEVGDRVRQSSVPELDLGAFPVCEQPDQRVVALARALDRLCQALRRCSRARGARGRVAHQWPCG